MSALVVYKFDRLELTTQGPSTHPEIRLGILSLQGDYADVVLGEKQLVGLRDALEKLRTPVWAVPYNDPPEGFWILEVRAPTARAAVRMAREYLKTYPGKPRIDKSRIRRLAALPEKTVVERGEEEDYGG